jgi:hypothetical protein
MSINGIIKNTKKSCLGIIGIIKTSVCRLSLGKKIVVSEVAYHLCGCYSFKNFSREKSNIGDWTVIQLSTRQNPVLASSEMDLFSKTPDDSEVFTILVSGLTSTSNACFTMLVGAGSCEQDFGLDCRIAQ